MDLSIVIVSWNTRRLLQACLRSVFDHLGGLHAEVLVVDNASRDGSAELVAREFPEARLIANDRNVGFAAANNQAIRESRGRHLLLLNSDTEVLAGVLPALVRYGDTHPEVGVLGCRVLNPDRSLQPTCFRFPSLASLLLLATGLHRLGWPRFLGRYRMVHWRRDDERDVDVVTGCCMLVRRSASDEVGLLDEQFFMFGEETDWCTRFRHAGWAVRFAPVGEIIHYGGASAEKLHARRGMLLWGSLVRLHRKHGGRAAAAAAWALLWMFNASRSLLWGLAALVSGDPEHRGRAGEYWAVATHFGAVWPRDGRGAG